ncbi:MAG: hypothetical protein EXS58_13275 [Candidatus Latescibacteria bacterium]|nr:hypothetical protein [Candidatus Latescibacterota bacterium]
MPITRDMKDFNLAVNTHVDRRRPICIDVGNQRQLLFDDFFIALGAKPDQYPYRIRWVNAPIQKHPSPLFAGEAPWETSSAWVSVMRDGGIYRMWYNSGQEGHRGLVVSYAESEDGLHFIRKRLGLVEFKGTLDNNMVFTGGLNGVSPEMGNVFLDPGAPQDERYKMIYTDWEGQHIFDQPFTHNVGMLRGAASPDGLRWERYYDNFTHKYCDSQNAACWDLTLGMYVAYHRTSGHYGSLEAGGFKVEAEGRGRAIGRLESRDFRNWQSTGIALQGDFEDGLNCDIYNSGYSPYPGAAHAHFLFPSFYNHYEGKFEVRVCTSRDNRNWFRPTRQALVPLGERGAFDCFIISISPGFVPVDRDHYALYYRAGNGLHSGAAVPLTEEEKKKAASRVGRVLVRRDRIIGIEAGSEPGQFCTRPLLFTGDQLQLNIEPTGPNAWMRTQLLSVENDQPLGGYTFAACRPLTQDSLDAQVSWEGREKIEPGPVRLHFQFSEMRLYAFQFNYRPSEKESEKSTACTERKPL